MTKSRPTAVSNRPQNKLDSGTNGVGLSKAQLRRFHKSILDWYELRQRDLPWRKKPTLYRVWLSEVMLQQTQVETVVPYFNRFVKVFPNIKQLANAPLDDVLKLWEGLGYYRRARSLHAAAQKIRDEHQGRFPKDFDAVLALPGVGRYTAGAILSIANGARLPILEGNTIRLFARLMNLHADVKQTETQKQLWTFAESILPEPSTQGKNGEHCGDFNQALMELGNQICTPKQPNCKTCPVIRFCSAYDNGCADLLPVNSAKQKTEELFESLFVISRHGRMLVRKCLAGERWQGLYDFPRLMQLTSKATRGTLNSFVERETGFENALVAGSAAPFWKTTHHVTKYKINLDAFEICLPKEFTTLFRSNNHSYQWASGKKLDALPLNKTAREAYNQLKTKKP